MCIAADESTNNICRLQTPIVGSGLENKSKNVTARLHDNVWHKQNYQVLLMCCCAAEHRCGHANETRKRVFVQITEDILINSLFISTMHCTKFIWLNKKKSVVSSIFLSFSVLFSVSPALHACTFMHLQCTHKHSNSFFVFVFIECISKFQHSTVTITSTIDSSFFHMSQFIWILSQYTVHIIVDNQR